MSKVLNLLSLMALLTVGAKVASADQCCKPGAPCCTPGATCCKK